MAGLYFYIMLIKFNFFHCVLEFIILKFYKIFNRYLCLFRLLDWSLGGNVLFLLVQYLNIWIALEFTRGTKENTAQGWFWISILYVLPLSHLRRKRYWISFPSYCPVIVEEQKSAMKQLYRGERTNHWKHSHY